MGNKLLLWVLVFLMKFANTTTMLEEIWVMGLLTGCAWRALCKVWPSFSSNHIAAANIPECAYLKPSIEITTKYSKEIPAPKEI